MKVSTVEFLSIQQFTNVCNIKNIIFLLFHFEADSEINTLLSFKIIIIPLPPL